MKKIPLFKRIRESKAGKVLAVIMVAELTVQCIQPLALQALTSGPTQPEVQGFQPVGMSQMVDPFTGDFSYNIPLMEVGGYPLNLSYQSGISMDQEASWAGLGWNLHTGAITRQMRGLPDDFWNDEVIERVNLKPNKTVGVNVAFDMELFGFEANNIIPPSGGSGSSGSLSVGLGIEYNNYAGVSLSTTAGLNLSGGSNLPMNASLNLTSGSDGLQISPNISYSGKLTGNNSKVTGRASIGIGASINSRKGLTDLTLSGGVNASTSKTKTDPNDKNKVLSQTDGKVGINNSSTISFGAHTFTPSIENAMETYSFSGRFKIGGATLNQDFGGSISGYGSVQQLVSKEFRAPAYGYIYAEKANNNDNALLDYNREKDNNFSKHHKHLPLTAFTQDMFSIAAQGLGGSFRAFRNDVGYVYNNKKTSPSTSGSLGLEIGLGNIVDLGLDLGLNSVQSTSGPWRDDNQAIGQIPFRGKVKNDIKENYFLRMTGEKIPEQDMNFMNNTLKGKQALRYNLSHTSGLPKVKAANSFTNADNGSVAGISNNARDKRQPRNNAIYFLTAQELKSAYPHKANMVSPHAKPHHIAQIVVVMPEGMRYVFGLAAYNTKQVEKSFAVGGTRSNPNSGFASGTAENAAGLVNYDNTAASSGNNRGIDNYYQETETPAYAHSWMLTEVLSPDYSDLKGDGPTQDDLGSYVLLNYGNKDGSGNPVPDVQGYGWRTPTAGSMKAGYMEGLKTNPTDDKASIVYGTKDIWYCHSIESKTHRVLFELEDRLDGCGVDPNGNVVASKKQKCIKSISYYTVESPANTNPVKKVNFVYDYTLCPNSPNSLDASKGKLTLKRLFFTYGDSYAGQYSPYEFNYNATDNGGNPFAYVHGNSDRWGQIKKPADNPAGMSNSDFPYSVQDKAKQDMYAAAWSLNAIDLPSGGRINIGYESDDYAYVQDRRASNMYIIKGFASSPSGTPSSNVFTLSGLSQNINEYLILNVPDAGATLTPDEFRKRYLQEEKVPGNLYGPLKYLYFRFLMNVNKPSSPKYEYVSGYAEIDYSSTANYGMINPTTGFVKIRNMQPTPAGVNSSPFAYAAWSFSRVQTPEYAYNQPQFDDTGFEQIIKTIASASIAKNLFEMLMGVNRRMMLEGYGSSVDVNKSWVRLFDPDGHKFGGGLRVKTISVQDNWDKMSPTETGRKYGQEYRYVLEDGRSSGVAAYEPSMGADENPFKLPVYSDNPNLKLVMEERFYIEEPFGESFFPGAGVGYARVEVKDIVYDAGVTSKSTGRSVEEFYTARDFPIITRNTKLDAVPKKSNPIVSLLSFNSWNFMNVSQGYSIEVNDMHGKKKASRIYAEGATEPLSYTEYYYRTDANGRLDNMFPVLDTKGEQTISEVGVEYDMVADFREQNTESMSGSLAFNLNYGQAGPIPIISFSLFPGFKRDHTRFRSAVVTKVIQRYGLEEKRVSYEKGALLETRTLALDKMTGNTLVQELTNAYRDKYYRTELPAHWAYKGMGQASENILFSFGTSGSSDVSRFDRSTGEIKPTLYPYLLPGDEVFMYRKILGLTPPVNSNAYRYWVARDASENKLYLIDYTGNKATFSSAYPAELTFYVVRSGHRNVQHNELGGVTSVYNPIQNVSGVDKLVFNDDMRPINTNANEYAEQWQTDFSIPRVESEMVVHTYQNQQADDFIALLNLMYGNGFLGPYPGPIGPGGWQGTRVLHTNPYGPYLQPLFGCTMASLGLSIFDNPGTYPDISVPLTAFGYSTAGINTVLSFNFGPIENNSCMSCLKFQIVSAQDTNSFTMDDWWNIGYFNSISSTQVLTIPGYANPVACHLISAVMITGVTRQFIIMDHCFGMNTETVIEYITKYNCINTNQTINPYIANILGNWRAKRSWLFQGDRNNRNVNQDENLRRDGYIAKYRPFWTYNTTSALWEKSSGVNNTAYNNWNWTSEMTVYSPYGFDLENRDPLGIFSAAMYGFKNMLATGVASNAMNKEIAFDGFEDYYTATFGEKCARPQSWFANQLSKITSADAHSGKYAMVLTADYTKAFKLTPALGAQQSHEVPYVLNSNDLLQGFAPNASAVAARKFILSFWAKGNYTNATYDYTNISADVRLNGSTPLLVAGSLRKSDLVEGWQKYEYAFNIPAGSTGTLDITFGTGGQSTLFDDIRIHPFDGHMKTFVYDRESFLFRAEMDENNFGTFYEYSPEGKLVRVKKETMNGMVTTQESQTNMFKR
ncbi:MAG: hypothetical protein ACT6QS_02370 [Flavobacteriales bacterium]